MTSVPDHDPDHGPVRDRATADTFVGQLVGALLCALALVWPLRGALGVESGGTLLLWLLGALVLALVIGRLLEEGDVPRPFGTCLAAAGVFAVLALAALSVIALFGDPGTDNELSLLVGLPAAALAAVGAATIQRRSIDDHAAIAAVVGGFLVVLVASVPVGRLVHDARDDAAGARILAEAGLDPFVPEIEGLEATYSGTIRTRAEDGGPRGVTGYELRYRQESAPGDASGAGYVTIVVRLDDDSDCVPSEGIGATVSCDEGDGYVVEARDGEVESVTAETLGLELVATLTDGDGELPSAEEVGQAMAKAEIGEWDDVVGLDEE